MDDPMQVETHVMVGGRYQTQRANILEILAKQRASAAPDHDQHRSSHAGPQIGLVSRTLLHSPMVNYVFPARIRREQKNDLVFVGEDFVQVKEASADGRLHHVAFQATNSHIRDAAILGCPPAEGDRTSEPKGKGRGNPSSLPPDILVCTLETGNLLFMWAEDRPDGTSQFRIISFALPIDTSYLRTFGKHVAVDSDGRAIAVAPCEGQVMFYNLLSRQEMDEMWANSPENFHPFRNETTITITGTILKIEFLRPSTNSEERHLASLVVIFKAGVKLRFMCYEWDVRDAEPKIDTIIKAYPLPHEITHPQMVIPLELSRSFFLVCDNTLTHVTQIQTRSPIAHGPMGLNDLDPRYPGLSTGAPLFTHWSRTIRHASWKNRNKEAFYLVREDGWVIYLEVDEHGTFSHTTAGSFDCHINKAFAAFMIGDQLTEPDYLIASGSMSEGQLLRIGGDVPQDFTHPTRANSLDPQSVQVLQNWAPVADMVVADLPPGSASGNFYDRRPLDYPSIFTTAGGEPYGAVVEHRLGLELRNATVIDSDLFLGTTKIWTFWDEDAAMFILTSRAEESNLFRIQHGELDEEEFTSTNCGFNPEHPTVAAGDLGQYVVQVTPEAAFVCSPTHEGIALPQEHTYFPPSGAKFVAADIDQDSMTIALVTRHGISSHLHLVEFGEDEAGDMFDQHCGSPFPLPPAEVTCIRNMNRDDAHAIFLGLSDGTIAVFSVSPQSGLSEPFYLSLSEGPTSTLDWNVAESISVLENTGASTDDDPGFIFLCGLRSGEICHDTFHFRTTDAGITEIVFKRRMAFIRIGHSSVYVTDSREVTAAKYAYGVSGSVMVRIASDILDAVKIERLWLTDENRSAVRQPTVSTLAAVPLSQVQTDQLEDALGYIVGEHLILGAVCRDTKPVPRRIDVPGSPSRTIYSPILGAFVVASVRTDIPNRNDTPDRKAKPSTDKRIRRAVIYIVKPDGDHDDMGTIGIKQENGEGVKEHLILGSFDLFPGERVHGICEWELDVRERRRKDCMLLVGTSYIKRRSSGLEEQGRVLIMRVTKSRSGTCRFSILRKMDFPKPVRAVISYEQDGVVICAGKSLILKRYSKERKRLVTTACMEMLVAGFKLSVLPSAIHVSTSTDSVMSYRIQRQTVHTAAGSSQDPTLPPEEFVLYGADRIARTTATHLEVTIDDEAQSLSGGPWRAHHGDASPKLLLVSDRDRGVAALWLPPSPHVDQAEVSNRIASEILLNRSITTLQQLPARPPWRDPPRYVTQSPSDCPSNHGVLADNILGTSHDGTFFTLTVVDEPSWRLLRFIQNLITSVTRITEQRPVTGGSKDREEDEEDEPKLMELGCLNPDRQVFHASQRANYHVNGDILMELLKPGAVDELIRMLRFVPRRRKSPPGEADGERTESQDTWDMEFGSDLEDALSEHEENERNKRQVEERVELFRRLACAFEHREGDSAVEELEVVVERVLKWTRVVLTPFL